MRVAAVKSCVLGWIRKRRGEVVSGQRNGNRVINVKERHDAERMIFKAVQQEAFPMDDHRGKPNRRVTGGKTLAALCPFVDEWGLMRCGGRLASASQLEYDSKFPIILPYDHEVVRDLLMHLHISFLHAGVDQLLGETRRRYWVTKGRRAARHTVTSCVRCQRAFKAPMQQQMAPLPQRRLIPTAVFEEVGLDCMGHFLVKLNGRADHKVWAVIFTCMRLVWA